MDILMLSPLPPPSGGIASWTKSFITYCENNDITVRIVDISVRGNRAEREVLRRSYIDEIKRTSYIFSNLKKELKKKKPTIMHINTSCAPLGVLRDAFCLKSALKKDIPVVLHCHCNIEDQLKGGIPKKAFSWMVQKATQIIVLNETSFKYVRKISGKKVCILPNFISDDNLVLTHNINTNINTIVYVGHIEYAKGIKEFLSVAEALPDIQFILVGPVREDISVQNHPANVIFTGKVDHEDVKCYLSEADVFLFLSHSEGFSIALLEAMAAGLPIIATDVGANRDMIGVDGGFIVPIGDSMSIVSAVNKLMCDMSMRQKMSKRNIYKVKNEYLTEVVMGKLINIYRDLS